jgi:hypothetical protein
LHFRFFLKPSARPPKPSTKETRLSPGHPSTIRGFPNQRVGENEIANSLQPPGFSSLIALGWEFPE